MVPLQRTRSAADTTNRRGSIRPSWPGGVAGTVESFSVPCWPLARVSQWQREGKRGGRVAEGERAGAPLAAAARPRPRPAANAIATGFGGHQCHTRRGRRTLPPPALPAIWGGGGCALVRVPPLIRAGWYAGRVAVRCARFYLSCERNDDPRGGVSRGTPAGGRERGVGKGGGDRE